MSEIERLAIELIDLVPVDARRVLEIGPGALIEAYRLRNPKVRCVVAGLGDPLPAGPFDAIVITSGSVSDRFLSQIRNALGPDGCVVIGVSNPAHWTVLAQLISGGEGRGEIPGLATVGGMLERAGFRRSKVRPQLAVGDRAQAEAWILPLAELAERHGIERQAFLRRCSTVGHALLARREDAPALPQMTIRSAAFALQLMDARTRLPAAYLGTAPDLVVSHVEKDRSLPSLPAGAPKLWIVQRHVPESRDAWIARLAKAVHAGWVVVSEWDDHPDLIAAAIPHLTAEAMWPTIDAAHAVQTSTEPLAEALRARNPDVRAFANAAFTLPSFPDAREGPARIFYGAANREGFSGPVAEALRTAIEAYPETQFEVVHDRRFFEALPTERKTFHPTLGYADYLDLIGRCDVVLTPLEGRGPERFKSDIKFVEAASRGAAVIASPAIYERTVRDGENGLIARTIADWPVALGRLLDDPALRRRLARTAWEEVRDTRMFADQVAERRAWYWSLWERREELTRALVARTPGLLEAIRSLRA